MPGRELGGTHLAMSNLGCNTRRLLDAGVDAEAPIDATGNDVVVIRGGTGTDCVGTAIRQGPGASASLSCWPGRRTGAPATARGPIGPAARPRPSRPTWCCSRWGSWVV